MATFTGTFGIDQFLGSTAADIFFFDVKNLTGGDIVSGGGGANDPLDQLRLSGSGLDVNFYYLEHQWPSYPFYSDITSIEQIYLSDAGSSIYLTSTFLNSSSTGTVEIFGTGNGNDVVNTEQSLYYTLRTATVIVHAGGGNDTISNWGTIYYANDILDGGDGDDRILGSGTLLGGNGNDTFFVSGIGTIANGGAGDDTFEISASNALIDGGDGIDTIKLGGIAAGLTIANVEHILVSDFQGTAADFAALKQFGPLLQFSSPQPTFGLKGGGTFDFRTFGTGSLKLILTTIDYQMENYASTIYGTLAQNNITGGYGSETIYGGNLDDVLSGGDGGADTIYGEAGNDTIYWSSNAGSTLHGGLGNDIFTYGSAVGNPAGAVFGDEGNDVFFLPFMITAASFTIDGGIGYDTLYVGYAGGPPTGLDDITGITLLNLEAIGAGRDLQATAAQLQQLSSISISTGSVTVLGSGVLDLTSKIASASKDIRLNLKADGDLSATSSSGNDVIFAEHISNIGTVTIHGGNGNDKITVLTSSAYSPIDAAYGDDGDDYIVVSSRDLTQVLTGITNVVKLYGGAGNDTFEYYSAGVFDGGTGTDTLNVSTAILNSKNVSNIEVLNITSSNNSLTTGFADISVFSTIKMSPQPGITPEFYKIGLTLTGDGSADLTGKLVDYGLDLTFTGQTRGVTITASDFADIIHGTAFSDSLSGGFGADFIYAGLGSDTVHGGAGNDLIFGEVGNDFLYGDDGNDLILTSQNFDLTANDPGGNSIADGGAGNDTIKLYGSNDVGLGGDGNDELFLNGANASADGGAGDDTFYVGFGNTALAGGTGSDQFVFTGLTFGQNKVDGGLDFDLLDLSAVGGAVSVDMSNTTSTFASAVLNSSVKTIAQFKNIEVILGSAFGDTLKGDASDNIFEGGVGADVINGMGGNDTASYTASMSAVTISLKTGQASGGDAQNDTLINIESLLGSTFGDSLTGDASANTIDGFGGDDFIDAGLGDDTVVWRNGLSAARVTGGSGLDILIFIDGISPIGFNLAAMSFEQAKWVQHDLSNSQTWTTVTKTYDSSWRLLSSTQLNDDNSYGLTTYDVAGATTWTDHTDNYTAAGVLDGQTFHWRSGATATTLIYYDPSSVGAPAGTYTWKDYSSNLDSQNRLTDQTFHWDAGGTKTTQVYYDAAGGYTWKDYSQNFDTSDRLTDQTFHWDSGAAKTTQVYYDVTGSGYLWKDYSQNFNTADQLTDQTFHWHSGAIDTTTVYYDPTNSYTWTDHSANYTNGVLMNETFHWDAGNPVAMSYLLHETSAAHAWTVATYNYDAANHLINVVYV